MRKEIKKAIAILEKILKPLDASEPITGDFTKELRRRVTEYRKLVSPFAQDTISILSRAEKACDRLDRAEEERDLAIAHDRQSYPTAQAYEKVCAALHKKEDMLDRAEAINKEKTIALANELEDCKPYAGAMQMRKALEADNKELLGLCEEFMEIADDGSARFDDPEPGSIFLRAQATIAKCEA